MRNNLLIKIILLFTVIAVTGVFDAYALTQSTRIALVPNAGGRYNFGGILPTRNFTGGYAPTFVNISPESIRDNPIDPLTSGGFDTVALVGICDINTFLSNDQFKSRLENFAAGGGKLIIWDSECQNTNYSKFVFPFTSSNPGARGATGTLFDVEENTLSSNNPSSSFYINTSLIGSQTDAVGDANVMVTLDPNWCIDMTAKNILGVTGPVHTYAQYDRGLIIYNGLDKDYLYNGQVIGTATGQQNLGKIWELELKQPWDPVPLDSETGKPVLPCLVPVTGLQLTPESATNPINTFHTITAKVTDQLGKPLSGVTIVFTVTSGPHAGTSGSAVTNSEGLATFTYKGVFVGIDTIEAMATVGGRTIKSKAVRKEWILALSDVRVIDTISKMNISLDQLSISLTPYSITETNNSIVIEWRYNSITIGQIENIYFYINLLNPVPGENRLVNHKLEVYYMDINGNPVMTELGPQYVRVLNSAFDSNISTDKTVYQANENVLINARITNLSEYARTIDAKILIEDSNGSLVKDVATLINLNFNAGETKDFNNLIFNTASTLAGNYRVHLVLYENQKRAGEASANFKIEPTVALSTKVTTDKISYNANENVTITSQIQSISPNYIFENILAKVTITNTQGQNLFTDSNTIPILTPGQLTEVKAYWNTATNPKGTYTVTLEAFDAGTLLSTSTTTFEIISTSSTGKGLTGTITAQPNPVYQGKDETITYSITNSGNEAISNLTAKVLIVNPETQKIEAAFSYQQSAMKGEMITGIQVISTINLAAGIYLAILQAQTVQMSEPKTLASTTFEVKPAIEATKEIPDVKNILVWLDYPWQSEQDIPDRALIEKALNEAGVNYHIVLDKKDFETELRNPYYTDFMILGNHNPIEDHFSEELREQIYAGKGLISSMFNRQNLNADVFGIKFIGYLSNKDYPIELRESEIAQPGVLQSHGRALKVEAGAENTLGWIIETTNKGTAKHPGIVRKVYGNGKILFYAFDLGMSSANYSQFALLLKNSLDYVHKPIVMPHIPNQLVPVEIKIKSLGGSFDLRITEIYPEEIKIYDPSMGQWITENTWIINIHLEPEEAKTILYYALTPDKAGTYTLRTEVGYIENDIYNFYQSLRSDIVVAKDAVTISGDIIGALNALPVTGQEKAKVDNAITHIQNVRDRVITTDTDVEQHIHDILKAIDSLSCITSVDISGIRLMMDALLMAWESIYYLLSSGG